MSNPETSTQRVRINATMTDEAGNSVELFPGGMPVRDALMARGSLALWTARADLVTLRGLEHWAPEFKTRHDRMDRELHHAAKAVRTFAKDCRQARWTRASLPSAEGLRDTCGAVLASSTWLVAGLLIDQCLRDGKVPKDRDGAVRQIIKSDALESGRVACRAFARAVNVPPAVEADLAPTGYTTAELAAMCVVQALRDMTEAFMRLDDHALREVLDDEGSLDGTPIPTAELRSSLEQVREMLDDVPAILREGVMFTMGELPTIPPLPE